MDWDAFEALVELTVTRLRQAHGNGKEVRAAIRHYINRGDKLIQSPMILWDYFAISDPGIPRRAGYTEEEVTDAMAVFKDMMEAQFGTG